MAIRVMIADDHAMFREGLKGLFERSGDFEVVAEADNGEVCLEKIKEIEPDVLLLDIAMPKKDGLDVLADMRAQNSKIKVLILTGHGEAGYVQRAVTLGAMGYVLKESSFVDLKNAIGTICQGQMYTQPISGSESKPIKKGEDDDRIESLTRRELEVLKLLAVGMYNKEIAEALHISERTVKNHVSNIFKKLEVADRTQAAVFAIRNKMIQL